MTKRERMRRGMRVGIVALCMGMLGVSPGRAQAAAQHPAVVTVEQPDAQRTREELSALLEHYPPALRGVLALDASLLGNETYLGPYPALVSFLNAHPEIARNPSFYLGDGAGPRVNPDHASQVLDVWKDVLGGLGVFAGFGMGIGLLVWLIRTFVDARRWSRIAKLQADVHTKLLDRFTANEDLLAYIQSPAGAKFLESSPITLDAAPRNVGAPMGRILWSVQGGVVLMAGGVGLQVVSGQVTDGAGQPLHALGVLGMALGLGFVVSAIVSYAISRRLGLIDPASPAARVELPGS